MRTAALVLALLPVAAQAQLAGSYAIDCRTPSEGGVTVTEDSIVFAETRCALSNPVSVRGITGAMLYDATCSGEGETWTDRVLLMPGAGGELVRVVEGYAFTYPRCD